jgi:hypothetical protein
VITPQESFASVRMDVLLLERTWRYVTHRGTISLVLENKGVDVFSYHLKPVELLG